MDDLDDYGLTLTHREVELILDALDMVGFSADEDDDEAARARYLIRKISSQTGVK